MHEATSGLSAIAELFVELAVGTEQTDGRHGVTRNAASWEGRAT